MNILSLDIGGTAIKSAHFQNDAIYSQEEFPSNAALGADALFHTLCNYIQSKSGFSAIGVSTSGQVDYKTGKIVYGTQAIPGYTGMPLKDMLQNFAQCPVYIDNDVNCAAIGEYIYGAAKNTRDFVCLTFGTGIGGAVFINGTLYHGSSGIAGEFGHLITHHNGKLCRCGKRGCYEAYASTTALCNEAYRLTGLTLNGREIFTKIKEPLIFSLINSWIDEIVTGIVSITHSLNPQLIILGGGVMEEPYLFPQVKKRFYHHIIESYKNTQIQKATLGNMAGVYGAFYIAKTNYERRS